MYRVEIETREAELVVNTYVTLDGKEHKLRFGWGLGVKHRALAERLKRAIEAGAVFPASPKLLTDRNGDTYVSSDFKPGVYVLGRTMNADLRRIGY